MSKYAIEIEAPSIIRIGRGARVYADHSHVVIRHLGGDYWFGPDAVVSGTMTDSGEHFRIELRPALLAAARKQKLHVYLYRPKARQRGRWRRHRRYSASFFATTDKETR